jgi:hypothetical protein
MIGTGTTTVLPGGTMTAVSPQGWPVPALGRILQIDGALTWAVVPLDWIGGTLINNNQFTISDPSTLLFRGISGTNTLINHGTIQKNGNTLKLANFGAPVVLDNQGTVNVNQGTRLGGHGDVYRHSRHDAPTQ